MSLPPISGSTSLFLDLISNKNQSSTTANSTSDLSDAAKFFSKLQNLSQTDPAKFKQLTGEISSELQTAAQSATGNQAKFLTDLANQFKTASQTGDASSLEPPTGSVGHHRHHASYQSSSDASNSTSSTSSGNSSDVLQSIFQQVAQQVAAA
jgi:hypothetical protein